MRIDVSELPKEIAELARQSWFQREVVITRDGQPWVKLVPDDAYSPTPRPGVLKGKLVVPDDFCETPEDVIRDFYE